MTRPPGIPWLNTDHLPFCPPAGSRLPSAFPVRPLSPAAQEQAQLAAGLPVRATVLVDPLPPCHRDALLPDTTGDLLGAPAVGQPVPHQSPPLRRHLSGNRRGRADAFPAPACADSHGRRRPGALGARPSSGRGPAAVRWLVAKARFSSARNSGTVLLGSGGGSPLAWRSPGFTTGAVAAIWPTCNILWKAQKSTTSGVALRSGTGE